MPETVEESPLNWTFVTTDIPERGLKGSRTATESERAALAKSLELMACDALDATYQITPIANGGFRLEGGIDAAVTQACVISLEPIAGRVSESFSVEFCREPEPHGGDGDLEILAAPDVEPLNNNRIDVGRIVFEALSAGLDPYPRKEGAEFSWSDPKAEQSPINPFAVLKQLKDKS